MTITQKEVRTIYSIRFTLDDYIKAFELYLKHPLKDIGEYDGAFNGLSTDSEKEDFEKNFKAWGHGKYHTATIRFIVKQYFKFDGIENYGFYEESKDSYKMSVYNYGDDLNY